MLIDLKPVALKRKPLSDLEDAGMGENPSARLTLLSTSGEAGYYRDLFRYLDEFPYWRIPLSCCGPWRHSVVGTSPLGSVDPSAAFLLGGGLHAGLLRIVEVFPWRVIPLSIARYCFSLGPGDRDRDLSRAPASVDSLAIGDSRQVFPGDEGFQHGHEMGSRIHPPERPDLKNSGLAIHLCSPLARYPLPQIRPV
ncbi:hypothetical protein F2Q69_00046069 [Brassica cretica]|uniref:Uncharacterized protein n=1 Tax=Brassica cretica TaxID=69181 RepID=A0A8S9PYG0_BRACR|nr:hypothetical protein F2Q69_00046069 [Brassica cretica]